jgi:lipopolysaccharide transport system permease protein
MKEITIEASKNGNRYWKDIWQYRELLGFLVWRDILVRYKQTMVGVLWAIIRPTLTMAVLTLVFGRIAGMDSGSIPYPLLVFCGLLPWQFFASSFSECGNSLVSNSGMITKVFFPRMIVPCSSVLTGIVDFFISLALLGVLVFFYRYPISPRIAILPFYMILAFALALGAGLWVSAMMVRYRDFRFIVPFVVQFGLYLSPVGFSSARLPQEWLWLYSINPMVGIIEGFRWCILGVGQLSWESLLVSNLVVIAVLITGVNHFRKTETSFADVI